MPSIVIVAPVNDRPTAEYRSRPSCALQASILPRARTVWPPAVRVPTPFGFPLRNVALVAQLLQRQHAVTVRLAVRKLSFVMSGRPGLRALVDLAAVAPLALVGLAGCAVLRPSHGSVSFCATVGARSRPGDRFVQLRVGVPHLASGFCVSDPRAGSRRSRPRSRCRPTASLPRAAQGPSFMNVDTIPVLRSSQCGNSGTTIPLSNSSRTSIKRSRTLPSASMIQVIGTPLGMPNPSSVMAFATAVG